MEKDVEFLARLTMSGLVGASMRFWSDRLPYDYFGNHIFTSQFPDHLHKDQYDFQFG